MPETSIPLNQAHVKMSAILHAETRRITESFQREIKRQAEKETAYWRGVRDSLGIPDDYVLNLQKGEFRTPETTATEPKPKGKKN